MQSSNLSRRQALGLVLGAAGALSCLPSAARADTQAEIDAANARLAEFDAQLEAIASDYSALAAEQSRTLDDIEETQGQIEDTEDEIEETQAELDTKRDRLSRRISSAYKAGTLGIIDTLLSSASFEELTSNIYYLDKVNESESQMIETIRQLREALDAKRAELLEQKDELEVLSQTQQEQMEQMQAKQEELRSAYDAQTAELKELIDKRDAELAAQAAEAARQAAAAAAAAASVASTQSWAASPVVTGSGPLARVLSSCYATPSPGSGLCAMWVSQVFSNAGFAYGSGNANDMYNSWCYSSNRSELQPGMVVAVSSWPGTSAGRIYGHIGIYIGGGTIMDNVGFVRTIGLDSWLATYGPTVTPRWGWFMGIELS